MVVQQNGRFLKRSKIRSKQNYLLCDWPFVPPRNSATSFLDEDWPAPWPLGPSSMAFPRKSCALYFEWCHLLWLERHWRQSLNEKKVRQTHTNSPKQRVNNVIVKRACFPPQAAALVHKYTEKHSDVERGSNKWGCGTLTPITNDSRGKALLPSG